jgi:hypothetical protein
MTKEERVLSVMGCMPPVYPMAFKAQAVDIQESFAFFHSSGGVFRLIISAKL